MSVRLITQTLILAATVVGAQAHAQMTTTTKAAGSAAKTETGSSNPTVAEDGQISTTIKEVKKEITAEAPKKDGAQDEDEVITNRRLRAEIGAKKKFSAAASLAYYGGSLKEPGAETRPNITAALGTQTDPQLAGSVGMKYKLNPLNTLSLSIGVGIDKPFHSDKEKSFGDRTYANDPSLGYTTVYKVGGVQNVTSLAAGVYTNNFSRELGGVGLVGGSQSIAYDFGGSKATVGTSVNAYSYFYEKDDRRLLGKQPDFKVGIYPFFEYVFTDRLNFRTLVGFMSGHSRATPEFWTWIPSKVYQSVGLGISVTRDIYLYPNIQLIPEDIRDDRTNIAMSATINL